MHERDGLHRRRQQSGSFLINRIKKYEIYEMQGNASLYVNVFQRIDMRCYGICEVGA